MDETTYDPNKYMLMIDKIKKLFVIKHLYPNDETNNNEFESSIVDLKTEIYKLNKYSNFLIDKINENELNFGKLKNEIKQIKNANIQLSLKTKNLKNETNASIMLKNDYVDKYRYTYLQILSTLISISMCSLLITYNI